MPRQSSTPKELMFDMLKGVDELNRVSSRLLSQEYGVFLTVSLETPNLSPSELGFIRVTTWLYVHYYEAGKVGLDFLESKVDAYSLIADDYCRTHRKLIGLMRTFLQHNLDLQKQRDRVIQDACEEWLDKGCRTKVPSTEAHWAACLIALLKDSIKYLEVLCKAVRQVEADESREEICRQWKSRAEKHLPPHRFDELVAMAAIDMGRESIDPCKFRKQYYDKWSRELALLSEHQDVEREARRLIEHSILTNSTPTLPITGMDIISELAIEPGTMVGQLLEKAQRIYSVDICSREALLDK